MGEAGTDGGGIGNEMTNPTRMVGYITNKSRVKLRNFSSRKCKILKRLDVVTQI